MEEIVKAISALSERSCDLRSRFTFSDKENTKYFKNLGRKAEGYRILANGDKQKSAALKYTIHEEIREYFDDLNNLIGELLLLSPEQAITATKLILNTYKLPFDSKFVPNWSKFCSKFKDSILALTF